MRIATLVLLATAACSGDSSMTTGDAAAARDAAADGAPLDAPAPTHLVAYVSGNAPSIGWYDVDLATGALTSRGQVATFEGVLRTDVDIGIGYSYPLLLEDATLTAE